MNTLNAAWVLAQKDLRSFFRDRTAMVLSILVPIALVSVFGWIMAYAFGGSGGMPKVSLHVADLNQTDASERLVKNLSGSDMIRVRKVTVDTEKDAAAVQSGLEKLISDGDAHHVLVVPLDYDAQLASGETPKLQMIRDPGRQMEDRVVQISILQATMSELGGNVWVDAMDRMLAKQGMQPDGLSEIRGWMTNIGTSISDFAAEDANDSKDASDDKSATEATGDGAKGEGAKGEGAKGEGATGEGRTDPEAKSASAVGAVEKNNGDDSENQLGMESMLNFMSDVAPVETTDISPPNRAKQVTYQQAQSVAGMTVMMLLFALTSCGSVLLVEREEGTLKRLFAQPVSRNSILLGKFLFVLIVGMCQMAILFLYGEWMFRVGLFRDPVTLFVLSLTWVIAGGAFGMFLASVSRSTKQAESLASLLILMMAALGGCWFPLQMMNLPTLLDTVCKSTMTFWAMTGFQGMLWNQLPWYSDKTLIALGWQFGWAIVLTGFSVFFFRRNFCRG